MNILSFCGRKHRVGLGLFAVAWSLGGLILAGAPARAFSAADLYARTDSASLMEGGADLPGQITGRPDVGQPTSLGLAEQPTVRLDSSSLATGLRWGGNQVGSWDDRQFRAQFWSPLGRSGGDHNWVVGMETERAYDDVGLTAVGAGALFHLSSTPSTLSVAYRGLSGWTLGGSYGGGDNELDLNGQALKALLPSSIGPILPVFTLKATQVTLGADYRHREWEYGAQWSGGHPGASFRLGKPSGLALALDLPALHVGRTQAYVVHFHGREKFFLSGWSGYTDDNGSFSAGVSGLGAGGVSVRDADLAVGWRRQGRYHRSMWTLDRRCSELDLGGQGKLSGGRQATLSAQARLTTWSLRYGYRRTYRSGLLWGIGAAAQSSRVTAEMGLRGGGLPPTSLSVPGHSLEMLAATPGVGYQNRRVEVLAACTVALLQSDDFDTVATLGKVGPLAASSPTDPASSALPVLETHPLWSLSAVMRF